MIRYSLLLAVTSLAVVPSLSLANWAESMFPVKTHEFGTVAVASKTEFRFPIHNTSNSALHIQTVRASCGCTTPIVETPYIAPGQSGSILARFNTDTFRGKRGATLTVVIDQPQYTEVRLRVDGYIRQDMVFNPGAIDFGKVNKGESHVRSAKIQYAGRDDWSVVDVLSNKPWMSVEVKQESRGSQRVTYDVSLKLDPSAPAGYFQDEVIVVTNDRSMPRVPLRVSGELENELSISPQSILLGALKPGEAIERQLVVRGKQPFVIESLTVPGFDVSFDPITTPKTAHVFTATFTADGTVVGAHSAPVTVKTGGESPSVATALMTAQVRDK